MHQNQHRLSELQDLRLRNAELENEVAEKKSANDRLAVSFAKRVDLTKEALQQTKMENDSLRQQNANRTCFFVCFVSKHLVF